MDRSPPAPAFAHGRRPSPSATHKEEGADMDTTAILLVPLLVLGIVMAFAFAGCGSFGATETPPEAPPPPVVIPPPPIVVPPPHTPPPPTHPATAYLGAVMQESTQSLKSYWRLGEGPGATTAADNDPL